MAETMTIGQVADVAGLNPSAIRYYERAGLLPEATRVGGKRRYDDTILRKLSVLDVAKKAGFSLDEIRLLFDATDGGTPAHLQLKELADRKIPEIEALIAQAQEVRSWLEMTSACTCDTLEQCSLFDQGFPETSGSGCSTC
jgi:MerR family transcriptional regulator, redox-sensitive transcriptional activator SoxR